MLIKENEIPQYNDLSGLKYISCRAVIINGKPTGEYHLKSSKVTPLYLYNTVSGMLEDTNVALIDQDNTLGLEYKVCIVVNSVLVNEMIDDYMKKIDDYIGGLE